MKSDSNEIKLEITPDVFLRCYKYSIPPQLFVDEHGNLVQSIIDVIGAEPDIDFLWGGRDSGVRVGGLLGTADGLEDPRDLPAAFQAMTSAALRSGGKIG